MKAFTESGVLFPDDWENELEEPVLEPVLEPVVEPAPDVPPKPAQPRRKLKASDDVMSEPGTPCLKRADLVEMLCSEHGLDLVESRAFVAKFFDVIFAHLAQGHQVKLSGLGKFSVRRKAPRPARNPWTGDAVMIDERTVVCYQSSDTLNARISEQLGKEKKA